MRNFFRKLMCLSGLSILYLIPAACTTPTPAPLPTLTARVYLTPYIRATPSRTPLAPTPLPTFTVTPTPTATPFVYVLKKDDTLLGLAIRYGISLVQIMAANPGIDAHFLSVGKTIVIPISVTPPAEEPTPTIIPLQSGDPVCYSTGDGGAWCVLLIKNDQAQAVENVSAWLGLYSASGKPLASQVVVPPLNLIGAGQALPVMAYFASPLAPGFTARGRLLTAIIVENEAERYLAESIKINDVQIAPGGKQAEIRGQVELTGTAKASALWVAAVAYGENGEVVGMRSWEAETDPGCLAPLPSETPVPQGMAAPSASARRIPRRCQAFDLTVFSLGPTILRVDVLAEARP
jgi:LysM repeat protein